MKNKDEIKNKYEGKSKNIFIQKENGLIIQSTLSYEKTIDGFTKLNLKSEKDLKEYNDFLNKVGKYKPEIKPIYDIEKMWDILENEIPTLKKYRKAIREGN